MSDFNLNTLEWRDYILSRCKELHPVVFGVNEPNLEDVLIYFKFNQILRDVFNLGSNYEGHPRNPFFKKNLDKLKIMDNDKAVMEKIKEASLITYLQSQLDMLYDRVFGEVEPTFSDRLTYFAYNNYLFVKFNIGMDLNSNLRNPWVLPKTPPLDFSEYGQIRQLPEEFQNKKTKTQLIPLINPVISEVNFLPPAIQSLWRVFDIQTKSRNVYQGTEADCYRYATKCNKDMGFKRFDWEDTNIKFVPRIKGQKKITKVLQTQNTSLSVIKIEKGCGFNCGLPEKPKQEIKSKVQNYLEKCKLSALETENLTIV